MSVIVRERRTGWQSVFTPRNQAPVFCVDSCPAPQVSVSGFGSGTSNMCLGRRPMYLLHSKRWFCQRHCPWGLCCHWIYSGLALRKKKLRRSSAFRSVQCQCHSWWDWMPVGLSEFLIFANFLQVRYWVKGLKVSGYVLTVPWALKRKSVPKTSRKPTLGWAYSSDSNWNQMTHHIGYMNSLFLWMSQFPQFSTSGCIVLSLKLQIWCHKPKRPLSRPVMRPCSST